MPPAFSTRARPATTLPSPSAPATCRTLSDIKFPGPIEVQISGSALLYELDAIDHRRGAAGSRPRRGVSRHPPDDPRTSPALHLRALRRALRRVGPLLRRWRVALQDADLPVGRSGGATLFARAARGRRHAADAACSKAASSRAARPRIAHIRLLRARASFFRLRLPGQSDVQTIRPIRRSGFHWRTRRPSHFPRSTGAAAASRPLTWTRRSSSTAIWHDNFCERRGFPVGQCPGGIGHQGQDIRPAPCKPPPGAERCTHRGNIVAVRDGVILRSPRQEAAYLFVNSANEHIRFRYLHMNPRKMDAEGC